MKTKILSAIVAILALSSVNAFAGDQVIVTKGDLSFMNGSKDLILFEANFDKTKIGKLDLHAYLAQKGEDHLADWPAVQEEGMEGFYKEFNKRNKGYAQIRKHRSVLPVQYKMVFEVLYMDVPNKTLKNLPFVNKSGGDTLSGHIYVYDMATDELVCELAVDEVNGVAYPADGDRLAFAMKKVAKILCGLAGRQ